MSKVFNLWVSMSGEFKSDLWGYVRRNEPATTFTEINNLNDKTKEVFNEIYDEGTVQRLFKEWQAAGRTYRLWNFYASKPEGAGVIKSDLNMLQDAYPQDFAVLGAWEMDTGDEVGTEEEPVWFPTPSQALKFMPDDNGQPATELTDVMRLMGQHPRDFTSFYLSNEG